MLAPRLRANWWVPGRLLPVGPGSRPGSRDGLGRGCCTHAPRMLGGPERLLCHQPSKIYLRSDMSRHTYIHTYIYISIHPHLVVRHIYLPVAVKIRVVGTSDVPIYLYPATVRVNRHVLHFPGPWPWSSSSTPYANWSTRPVTRNTTLPTGQPANPLSAADWSVLRPLRDAQHRAADWSTSPYCMISFSRLAPARRRRPAHQGHLANWPPLPSLAGAPPQGSPCGTTVQPAGCLAWAIPPGRGPRPPSHRQA